MIGYAESRQDKVRQLAAALFGVPFVFLALSTHAADPVPVGKMPNASGGWVLLNPNRGDCDEGWREVVSTDGNEVRFRGCWVRRGGKVAIIWQDGDARVYPRSAFGLSEQDI